MGYATPAERSEKKLAIYTQLKVFCWFYRIREQLLAESRAAFTLLAHQPILLGQNHQQLA